MKNVKAVLRATIVRDGNPSTQDFTAAKTRTSDRPVYIGQCDCNRETQLRHRARPKRSRLFCITTRLLCRDKYEIRGNRGQQSCLTECLRDLRDVDSAKEALLNAKKLFPTEH